MRKEENDEINIFILLLTLIVVVPIAILVILFSTLKIYYVSDKIAGVGMKIIDLLTELKK